LMGASESKAAFILSWNVSNTAIGGTTNNSDFGFVGVSAGGFTINGSATGNNTLGAGQTSAMDLSTTTITSSGAGTVVLVLTQNNLTSPLGPGNLTGFLSGHFVTGSGSASMISYGNDTNGLYGFATAGALLTPGGTTPPVNNIPIANANVATGVITMTPAGNTSTVGFNATSPYSMTQIITINFNAGGGTVSLSSDGSTTFTNPAPAGFILALTGAPVLGFGAWMRRRKSGNGLS